MFKTRYQVNTEAIAYNSKIAPLLEEDRDYCIRGMMSIEGFDLYCDYEDEHKEIQDYNLVYEF